MSCEPRPAYGKHLGQVGAVPGWTRYWNTVRNQDEVAAVQGRVADAPRKSDGQEKPSTEHKEVCIRISNEDFDKVQKRLQAQRGGNDDRSRRRVPRGAVKCDGCGSPLVVVRNSHGQCYYRCSKARNGDLGYAACRTLMRVPD